MAKSANSNSPAAEKQQKAVSKKRGDSASFGVEGTNKTLPEPQADALAGNEADIRSGPFIPKSPHTAGNF